MEMQGVCNVPRGWAREYEEYMLWDGRENVRMGHAGRSKLWPYMLQIDLTSKPSKVLIVSTHW